MGIDVHSQALALYLDIVSPSQRQGVISELLQDIVTTNKNHLTTGIVGSKVHIRRTAVHRTHSLFLKYLMLALSEIGRTDVAYAIATQTTYPSWGEMILNGATTLWYHLSLLLSLKETDSLCVCAQGELARYHFHHLWFQEPHYV